METIEFEVQTRSSPNPEKKLLTIEDKLLEKILRRQNKHKQAKTVVIHAFSRDIAKHN